MKDITERLEESATSERGQRIQAMMLEAKSEIDALRSSQKLADEEHNRLVGKLGDRDQEIAANRRYIGEHIETIKALESKLHDLELQATSRDEQNNDLQRRLDESQKALAEIWRLADGISDDMTLPEIGTIALGAIQKPLVEIPVSNSAMEVCPACHSNDVIRYDPPLYPKTFFRCRACSAEWEPTK